MFWLHGTEYCKFRLKTFIAHAAVEKCSTAGSIELWIGKTFPPPGLELKLEFF